MGCNCKGDKVNEVSEKGPISFKSGLNKVVQTIVMTLLLLILTPFIVLLIWYYGIGSVYGGKKNTLNLLLKYINRNNKVEDNIENEIDEDADYELLDVEIIK